MKAWLLAATIMACGESEPPATKQAKPDEPEVVQTDVQPEGFPGVVVPKGVAEVQAPFGTRVVSYSVSLGEKVKAEQELAVLDLEPLKAELASATADVSSTEAAVRSAGAEVNAAERAYQRARKLGDIISGAQVEQAKLAVSTASAGLRQARAALTSAKAKVEHLQRRERDATLRSPIDGELTARYIEPGSRVEENQVVLRVIAGPLFVKFAVPADAERPEVGAIIEIKTDDSHQTLKGRVTSVSSELDPVAKMHIAEAELTEQSAKARAGESCTVSAERKAAPSSDTKAEKTDLTPRSEAPPK